MRIPLTGKPVNRVLTPISLSPRNLFAAITNKPAPRTFEGYTATGAGFQQFGGVCGSRDSNNVPCSRHRSAEASSPSPGRPATTTSKSATARTRRTGAVQIVVIESVRPTTRHATPVVPTVTRFAASSVTSIVVNAGDGNDRVWLKGNRKSPFTVKATINGGAGDDRLAGGGRGTTRSTATPVTTSSTAGTATTCSTAATATTALTAAAVRIRSTATPATTISWPWTAHPPT